VYFLHPFCFFKKKKYFQNFKIWCQNLVEKIKTPIILVQKMVLERNKNNNLKKIGVKKAKVLV